MREWERSTEHLAISPVATRVLRAMDLLPPVEQPLLASSGWRSCRRLAGVLALDV